MNLYHKLSCFPTDMGFFVTPEKPGHMISRVLPTMEFTTERKNALVFFDIDLLELADILIDNFGYSAESLKSTLCYHPIDDFHRENNKTYHNHTISNKRDFELMKKYNRFDYIRLFHHY